MFCPITSRINGCPFEVQLLDSHSDYGVVLADQIRSLDWRARKVQFVEQAPPQVIAEVKTKFSILLTQDKLDWTMDLSEQFDELLGTAEAFLDSFELVFDNDWVKTKSCMEDSEYFISAAGTFVHPQVDDESNNWANRGSLLEHYRDLPNCLIRHQPTDVHSKFSF